MEQNVFVWGSSAFVTYKFLFERNVPEITVYNCTSKKNKCQWYVKRHPLNNRLKLIFYNSIPQSIIEKYSLPNFIELKTIAETESKIIREERSGKTSIILKTILDFEYNNWETITDIYKNEFFDAQKLESYCKTHLILSKIVELTEFGYTLNNLYRAYYQYEGLVFECINYHSFCNKIRKIKKSNCIEDELLHGLRKQESNNHRMSEDIVQEIQRLYSNPIKPSAREIHKEVSNYLLLNNRKPISLPSVERLIAQTWFKNECMLSRYGDKYTEEHLLPYLPFDSPNFEESLWLIDGTRFQFVYKTEKSKYNFLTYFIILEGKTRKVIGYSYDDSENYVMATRALEMACTCKCFLPKEIISDRSSAYKANEFARIISNLRDWGVIWRMAKHPRDNSYVERCFGVIQTVFCKYCEGYLGDGIKSKNLNGKP